jgi:UDP-N-acetylglucosamine 2-epimerase (non-hydrolysing)
MMTLHRDYNVDHRDKLEKILLQLNKVSRDTKIVFPIHPRTSKRIQEFGFKDKLTGLTVIEPVDYLNLMGLVKRSKFVITDSGGLQKEAYFSSKRAYVLMPDTGWIELVENKNSVLCDETNIYQQISDSSKASRVPKIYGVGDAGKKIVDILCK